MAHKLKLEKKNQMKNRKLQTFFIAISMTLCFLTGCGNFREEPLADSEEANTSEAESTNKESSILFSFSDISNLEFWFGSGAGAWCTVLTVHDDGSFEGEYHDSEMGDVGDAYPNGICYFSRFTGIFTEPEKINDYTYSVKIGRMELEKEPDTEEIKEGIKYIYSTPYGLEGGEEILIFMPKAPIQDLPSEYKNWMMGYGSFSDTQLPFYGLYNVNTGEGFSSHEKTTAPSIRDKLAGIEKEAAALEHKLQTETLTQLEMTTTASELYKLWDNELNFIWGQLKDNLDSAAMDTLTSEEREWIVYKENEIQKAGVEYEGGSMEPMVKNLKGAELTKAKVYQLAKYLP